jgi:ribonuclease BN (tRNA processing enzyme)
MHNAVHETVSGLGKKLHMTPKRMGQIASLSKTDTVVLSHFMNRTKNIKHATLKNMKASYSGKIRIGRALSCYKVK